MAAKTAGPAIWMEQKIHKANPDVCRLLMALDQLRPLIDGRPAAELALKVVPDFRGRVPAGLPHDWLPKQPAASA